MRVSEQLLYMITIFLFFNLKINKLMYRLRNILFPQEFVCFRGLGRWSYKGPKTSKPTLGVWCLVATLEVVARLL